jgi:hypothetical protein
VTVKQIVSINLRLPTDLHKKLKAVARGSNRSLTGQIIHMLRQIDGVTDPSVAHMLADPMELGLCCCHGVRMCRNKTHNDLGCTRTFGHDGHHANGFAGKSWPQSEPV